MGTGGGRARRGTYAEKRCRRPGPGLGRVTRDHNPAGHRPYGGRGAGGRAGPRVRALFQPGRHRSVRRGRVGHALGRDRQREGRARLRTTGCRDAPVLVAAGDQHCRVEVLPRADWDPGAREERQAADRPGRGHHHHLGPRAAVPRERRRLASLQRQSEAPPRLPEGRLQQSGLVQRRLREAPAVLSLLHQLRPGHDGIDPRPGQDRGHVVQVPARARARTSRTSARRRSCWRAAAPRRVRSRS